MLYHAFGLDPSLRHGALVFATFEFPQGESVSQYRILVDWDDSFSWDKKSEFAIGMTSPPGAVWALIRQVVRPLRADLSRSPVGVDWTIYSATWKGKKLQTAQQAYQVGYLTRAAHSLGHPVVYITPKAVRDNLALPGKADKTQAWDAFTNQVALPAGPSWDDVTAETTEDQRDALILAYCTALAAYKEDVDAQAPTAVLPSG